MTRIEGKSKAPCPRGAFSVMHWSSAIKAEAAHNSFSDLVCCYVAATQCSGQLTRKARECHGLPVGSYAASEQDFLGGCFQFQADKEARDKIGRKRGRIMPPAMGDNYTFWGVTL